MCEKYNQKSYDNSNSNSSYGYKSDDKSGNWSSSYTNKIYGSGGDNDHHYNHGHNGHSWGGW